jgi:hypothetical protein
MAADAKARLHSIETFAALVGIGRTKAWTHVKQGHVRVVYMGRCPKVPDAEIARIEREGLPPIRKSAEGTP